MQVSLLPMISEQERRFCDPSYFDTTAAQAVICRNIQENKVMEGSYYDKRFHRQVIY